jgi:4-hydroxybenzoate polyprenyltransferase
MKSKKENENIIFIIFTKFFRFSDTFKWSLISFIGFILGVSILSLDTYIIPFLVFITTTFCIMAFTFAINNYYDAKSDKVNPRRENINAIASGQIPRKVAISLLFFLVIIPLIITILHRLEIFIFCVFLLFLGWAYSAPPFRTKNIPVVDVIWHFIGFFSYIVWGSLISGGSIYNGSIPLIIWLMAVSIGIFSSIGQVGNHISDYSSDKETGTITFAVWAGLDKAKVTINFLTLLHIIVLIPIILFYTIEYYASFLFFIVIALLGLILLKPRRGAFPTKNCWIFYFSIIIGGAVYVSILIYHIYTLLDISPLDILKI